MLAAHAGFQGDPACSRCCALLPCLAASCRRAHAHEHAAAGDAGGAQRTRHGGGPHPAGEGRVRMAAGTGAGCCACCGHKPDGSRLPVAQHTKRIKASDSVRRLILWQMSGVNCECDGRVWRADAGMSSGVLDAAPQVRLVVACWAVRAAVAGMRQSLVVPVALPLLASYALPPARGPCSHPPRLVALLTPRYWSSIGMRRGSWWRACCGRACTAWTWPSGYTPTPTPSPSQLSLSLSGRRPPRWQPTPAPPALPERKQALGHRGQPARPQHAAGCTARRSGAGQSASSRYTQTDAPNARPPPPAPRPPAGPGPFSLQHLTRHGARAVQF